jgi:predicted DNA-binding protein
MDGPINEYLPTVLTDIVLGYAKLTPIEQTLIERLPDCKGQCWSRHWTRELARINEQARSLNRRWVEKFPTSEATKLCESINEHISELNDLRCLCENRLRRSEKNQQRVVSVSAIESGISRLNNWINVHLSTDPSDESLRRQRDWTDERFVIEYRLPTEFCGHVTKLGTREKRMIKEWTF